MDRVDSVVVGAGVVGLTVARALALQGREVLVLEAAGAIGTGTSSRNSEVIHAGIYYPAGSLKARLCVTGREMLYSYCAERHLPHRRCGKLIVATSQAQMPALQQIEQRARANGVMDLAWLSRDQARALEPQLECVAALLSPSTGIIDSHAFMLSLQADIENAGGMVALRSPVESMRVLQEGGMALRMEDGTELWAGTVVNAAGLSAPALARRCHGLAQATVPQAHYAKGSYFALAGAAPFSRLIYPVPEAAGLGVHLTLDLGGQAKFGPDVEWVESPDDLLVDPRRDPHPARLAQGLDPRRHVDAVAVDVGPVDHHVAEVDPDPVANAHGLGQFRILVQHRPLDLDRGLDRCGHAAELDDGAIALEVDEAAAVPSQDGLDQLLP